MAKKNDNVVKIKKIQKPLVRMNTFFNELIDNITGNSSNQRDKELKRLSDEVDEVIFDEIKSLTKFTGDDISTFLVKLFNEYDNASQRTYQNIEEIFTGDSGNLFSFFQERYRNRNLMYEDLNVICTQLFELREAINAIRDAVVTADDLTQAVSRTIKIKNSSRDENDIQSYISIVENMEKKFNLLQKLKDHIIPNTLQYGVYYVYTIPYEKLFQQHYEKKQKNELTKTLESVDMNFVKEFRKEAKLEGITGLKNDEIRESFNQILDNIEVCTEEDIGIPLVENSELAYFIDDKFRKQVERVTKKNDQQTTFVDGTVDVKKDKNADFSSFKECYIKLIDPRRIIPVKILDQVIGYYYIHQTELEASKSPFTTSIRFDRDRINTKEVETAFLGKITDKIVKAFDKKFLEENTKFRELILNALVYNDIYKKKLKFQFIPVDYITEYAVNRNEDGEGTSTILPSLFYAKLFLALMIFQMITIISRTHDTKIYYVRQSGIDQDVANKVQEIARRIKERQINFMDLLNYNSMISKVGHAKDIFMPIGRSGEKGIEFDILAGQDVQLNTELMEMLRTAFINATGVPSVIMNYINEADYAKTLVMANAKFLARVVNFQLDFNNATTELYRKILYFTAEIPAEVIDEIEFTLSTPKALNNMNLTDLINNTDQTIAFMIKAITGENAEQTEDDNILKDILYRKFAQEILPMLPWNRAESIVQEAKIELQKIKTERKKNNPEE